VAREHTAEETTAATARTVAAAAAEAAAEAATVAAARTIRTAAAAEEGIRGAGEGQNGHDQSDTIEHFLNLHLRTQMPASDVRLVAETPSTRGKLGKDTLRFARGKQFGEPVPAVANKAILPVVPPRQNVCGGTG